MRFAAFYLSRLRADRHFHHPKSMLKAAKNHFLKLLLAPKHTCFQSKVMIKRSNPSALICTCAHYLPHLAPRFGTFYPAFWCILPCILVQITLRFGAFYTAFWCNWQVTPQFLHINVIQNGVAYMCMQPHFVSKTTRARIENLQPSGRLVGKTAAIKRNLVRNI